MATRGRTESIRAFRGLSDRKVAVGLTNIENPDLLNVEFSERSMKRRNGFRAVHSNRMVDTSIRLDGVSQYCRIPHISAYDWATTDSRVCAHVMLKGRPDYSGASFGAISPVLTRGDNNTSSSVFLWIDYSWTNSRWQAFAYDPTGASLVSWTVSESTDPVNVTRCVEFGPESGTNNYELVIYDIDGNVVGSNQQAFSNGFITGSTDDWLIGAGINSGSITYFNNAAIAELRMFSGSGQVTRAAYVGKELPYQSTADPALDALIGYWRLNDGAGNECDDYTANSNNALIAEEGPKWVTDPTLVQGNSGIDLNGQTGGVVWTMPTGTFGVDVFRTTGAYSANLHFTVAAQIVLKTNAATGRADTGWIVHAGTGATPSPIGIEVEDTGSVARVKATYVTGPTTLAINIQNAWIGRPLRVILDIFGTTGPTYNMALYVYEADGSAQLGTAATTFASEGGPGTGTWCVGAKVSSTTWPFTFSNVFRGVIDDVKILRDLNNISGNLSLNYAHNDPVIFNEGASPGNPNYIVAQQLRLNEGFGRALQSEGAYEGGTATLYPEFGAGHRWHYGLVEPEVPPVIRRVRDYRRILPGGKVRRSLMVASGATLYEVDPDAGTATIRAGGLPRNGPLTAAQYADQLYIAGQGETRPQVWDGNELRFVGVAPPQDAPRAVTTASTGGSFADGAHHIYCTFRNRETGAESLPGPPIAQTFSAGTGTEVISSMTLPVSTDPQVNQRRVWMTVLDAGAGSTAYLVATMDDNTTGTLNATTCDTFFPLTDVDTNAITMDYLDNQEPPAGSLVQVYQDRLIVSGVPKFPTRIYWSQPGNLTSFNQLFDYVDADLDEGDPVNALRPLQTALAVLTNDGRLAMTPTGNADAPFFLSKLGGSQGAVADNAVLEVDGGLVVVGERDIYAWDGARSQSLSSPIGDEATSIETLLRTGIEDSRRGQISAAHHRSRNQLWFALPGTGATRNNRVLVYDLTLGVWSLYSMAMESLMEVEGDDEQSWIYGSGWGRVWKLDTGDWDGPTAATGGIVDSGTTTTLVHTTASWATDAYRGMFVSWYDVSSDVVRTARIRGNTGTTLTFQEAASSAPASPDPYIIGGIPWYADWHLSFGSPFRLKKLRWAKVLGVSDSDNNYISMKFTPDLLDRDFALGTEYTSAWDSSTTFLRMLIGGLGRSFRVRVGDTGIPTESVAEPIPSVTGRLDIHGLEFEAEEVEAL